MVKSLKVRFHSFVDLITNSSSTVYIYTHSGTRDLIVTLINEILEAGGSDETFDSLFIYGESPDEGEGLDIRAKDSKNYLAAAMLNRLQNLFEYEEVYNG